MTDILRIAIRRLPHGEGLPLPAHQTPHSAGMDLLAALAEDQPLTLAPGARALVPTGFSIALPEGFEAQIRPRSGLALKSGVTVLNAPGTIDADYRGEVGVLLINLGNESIIIRRADRIAQMVVARYSMIELFEAVELEGTTRGAGGFGSTGMTVR